MEAFLLQQLKLLHLGHLPILFPVSTTPLTQLSSLRHLFFDVERGMGPSVEVIQRLLPADGAQLLTLELPIHSLSMGELAGLLSSLVGLQYVSFNVPPVEDASVETRFWEAVGALPRLQTLAVIGTIRLSLFETIALIPQNRLLPASTAFQSLHLVRLYYEGTYQSPSLKFSDDQTYELHGSLFALLAAINGRLKHGIYGEIKPIIELSGRDWGNCRSALERRRRTWERDYEVRLQLRDW